MNKLDLRKRFEKIIEYLFYVAVFLLPWQTVFLVREIFVGGEKWQYGTVGVYLSDVVLVLLLGLVVVGKLNVETNFQFSIFHPMGDHPKGDNLKSIFNDEFKNKQKHVTANLFQNPKRILSAWFDKGILNQVQDDKVRWFAGLFLFWIALSIFWSPDKFLATYFFFKILLGVGLFFAIGRIKFDWKKLIFVLFVSAVFQAGLGVQQYLTQEVFPNKWLGISEHQAFEGGASVVENSNERWLRAYGGFEHPNVLGGFLVLIILVIIGVNFQFKIFHPMGDHPKGDNLKSIFNDRILKRKKYFTLGLLVVSCWLLMTGLFFSFSRTAWLALIVGLIILTVLKYKGILNPAPGEARQVQNDKVKWLMIILIPIISILVMNWSNFFTRFDAGARLEQKSVSDRVSYFFEAKEVIENNLFLGAGTGNYVQEVMKNDELKKDVWEYQPVHNVFLLIFSELGLIGLVLFVGLLILIMRRCGLESLPIFAALLIFMMLDHWLWTSHFGMLFFWLILGLTCCKKSSGVRLKRGF
ncbi:MAG: O-antigen ligase family protein [Candidatus Moranbacteria bacterium]|nr:O-antigen ligase family protein [Candidatus Moranbacteria bacterium]